MERQAYIRPSGGTIWSVCSGYAALNAALGTQYVEETDNEVREDGIACHWLAKEIWDGHQHSAGDLSPNDRELTDEMFMAVDEYHALIQSWGLDEDSVLMEEQVACSHVFPGVADGTPDVRGFNEDRSVLFLGDLKFGFRPVEAWRNVQMIIYAWTLICIAMKQGFAPQEARLFIYQPRCPHRDGTIREWRVGIQELGRLAELLSAAAQRCYAPNPPCTVNPGCRNCPAAYGCETLAAAAGAGVDVSYDATPMVLNEAQLAYQLARLLQAQSHIEHRITGLSMQAESLIRKGTRVPGFEMGRAGTRWRWRNGSEAIVRRLGELFGIEVMAEPKMKSVAKLRDALPEGIAYLYAEKPDGELKLRAVDPNEAIKRFMK